MSLTSQSRELLRQNLLQQVATVPGGFGLGALQLRIGARAAGHEVTEAEVETELIYLDDRAMIAAIGKKISPENRRWRITANGRDYLAEQGLD